MKSNFIVISLFFSLIFGTAITQEILGYEKKSGYSPIRNSTQILWDIHHLADPNGYHHPDSLNTILRSIVEEMGITLIVNDTGVVQYDLTNFDCIVVSVGTSQESPYSIEEASLIRDFVNEGGGLFIMGDHELFAPENINPLSQIFGTTTGLNLINPVNIIVTNLTNHPIFRGVDSLFFDHAGRIESSPPSIPVAWENAGQLVVSVAEFGRGRVVITGDSDGFGDPSGPFGIEWNMTFTRNIFLWLLRLDCSSFEDLEETISEARIHGGGVLRSLLAKYDNARRQYEQGNIRTSGNILCALLHEVDAQEGKHIEPQSAQEIRDCVHSLADALGISLPCIGRSVENPSLVLESSPNPFQAITIIRYTLPRDSRQYVVGSRQGKTNVQLAVYDITGSLVKTLVDYPSRIMSHESRKTVMWDGRDEKGKQVPNGIYFYRLESGDIITTKKITFLK
jgi:hypothetical protein